MKKPKEVDYRKYYKEYFGIDFDASFEVHHIDTDRSNNNIENLILLPKELHKRLHSCMAETCINTNNLQGFSECGNQTVCSIVSVQLKMIQKVYEDLQIWAARRESELYFLKKLEKSMFNYDAFRKGKE